MGGGSSFEGKGGAALAATGLSVAFAAALVSWGVPLLGRIQLW